MKIAMWTDIHWGAKNNSVMHNQDCRDYIEWFKGNVIKQQCDAMIFMGDWFENRNSINVGTMNASLDALTSLDALNIPIYFIIGNHDLFHRENRNQFSTYHYSKFKNIVLINETLEVGKLMFFPFLFKNEYPAAAALIEKQKPDYVFGHFEFRNFVVTGTDRKMDHGPDHTMFGIPKYLFSGHFHKRQIQDNVVYIGNTFPTNYGDAWDDERGMAILSTDTDELKFVDWVDSPKYRKVRLSDVLDGAINFPSKCRVRCLIDVDVAYSEAQSLREEMIGAFNLREFALEENIAERKEAIAGDSELEDFDLSSLNEAVIGMLKSGISGTTTIAADKLIEIYTDL